MGMRYLMIALLSLPALGEVYKVVDANGNITYTDQPQADTQIAPLALPPLNKIPAAELPQAREAKDTDGQENIQLQHLRVTAAPILPPPRMTR